MEIFGVKIDTSTMTLEEMKEKIELLHALTDTLETQYKIRLSLQHTHSH